MNRVRGALAGAAAALWLVGASAGAGGAAVLQDRLPNGVTILVRENPDASVVAANVTVRAGTRWEREDNSGITNFLQHVMVKGTRGRTALQVAEAAEDIGGSLSASGEADFAEIRGTALARHWRELLDLMAEVALRPALAEGEIEGERRVILSAIRSRGDQPFQRATDALMAQLYGGHPYALPAVGRAAAVSRLGRPDLVAHHERFYRAERTIVSVSGQVPAPEVAAALGRLFGAMPGGVHEGDAAGPPPLAAPDRLTVSHPAAQAQVLAGALAPPIGHPDYAAVKVLTTALGGGMAGRLFTELRDKRGLAYSTGAFYPSRVHRSAVVAYLGTAPANADRAEAGMREQIERLGREPLAPEELARAKASLLGQFALDRRSNARLAWYAAFFEAAGVGHDFGHRYARAVEAVSAEDILRVARAYLGAPSVVSLRPAAR